MEILNKDLALALGDAVWAFARIEWLVYECLGWLSVDQIDQLVGDLPFRSRTAILTRIVDRREADSRRKQRVQTAIEKAEKLSEKRNIMLLASEFFLMSVVTWNIHSVWLVYYTLQHWLRRYASLPRTSVALYLSRLQQQ